MFVLFASVCFVLCVVVVLFVLCVLCDVGACFDLSFVVSVLCAVFVCVDMRSEGHMRVNACMRPESTPERALPSWS